MTHIFLLPASEEYALLAERFTSDEASADTDALRSVVTAMANAYVDSVVQGLVLGLVTDGGTVSPFTESLMKTVANVVESVSTKLLERILHKAPREVIKSAGGFFRSRAERAEGAPVVTFPLSPEGGAAVEHGIAIGEKEPLVTGMHAVIENAMAHLYDAAFEVIPVSGMTKRAVVVGGTAMRSGAKSAAARAIRAGGPEDRQQLVAYLRRRTLERAEGASSHPVPN